MPLADQLARVKQDLQTYRAALTNEHRVLVVANTNCPFDIHSLMHASHLAPRLDSDTSLYIAATSCDDDHLTAVWAVCCIETFKRKQSNTVFEYSFFLQPRHSNHLHGFP